MTDIDVLVVGAGPTGLVLATELKRRGIAVRCIDKLAVASDKSRALVIHARSLELFQKMGVAEKLVAKGRQSLEASVFVKGKKRVDVECGDLNFKDTPYPFVLFLSQAETEGVLISHLKEAGLEIERSTELVSFKEDSEKRVVAVLRSPQGEQTVRCKYLVGADGAHSVVRKGLGLEFGGAPYAQDFMLADVEIDWEFPPDRFRLFFGRKDLLAFFPMQGKIVRLIGTRTEAPDKISDPTLEEMEAFAKEVTLRDLHLKNPIWLTRFRLHHRGVDRYGSKNCFVAGDAAHIHSPAGGQGMNTGIQDGYNLAWKLEWVLKKRAPESLLSTYHTERYPVGRFLLRFTDRLFLLGSSPNPLVLWVRNHLFPRFAQFILASPNRRQRALRTISQLGIRYRPNDFIVEGAGNSPGPKAGERAPDVPIGKTSLFALSAGTSAHLLVFEPHDSSANVSLKDEHYQVHRLKRGPETEAAFAAFRVTDSAYYLIRPDGYIGFRSLGADFGPIKNYLSLFG